MDPSSLCTQWSQSVSEPTQQQAEARPSTVDDWAKDRTNSTSPSATSVASPLHPNGLDISDFSTLTDLGSPPSTSALTPTTSFFSSYPPSNYFLSAYPTLPYGSGWSTQSSLPLSNYSSLNGATTSTTTSVQTALQHPSSLQHQQTMSQGQQSTQSSQAQSPPSPSSTTTQSIVIDPALTTLNTSRAVNGQHYPTTYNTTQPQSQSQPITQYPYAYLSTLYRSPYFQSSQLQSNQGTLSPQALHTPSSSLLSNIAPPSFYSTLTPTSALSGVPTKSSTFSPSSTPELSPEEQLRRFQASLKPLLVPSQFSGASAVNILVAKIRDFGPQEVDAATRLDILTKIRDGAGNPYFRAWSENSSAIEITRDWLKAAFVAEANSPLVETLMPLLHIIDRLPMTVDSLKASKLGKIVVKLVKEPFVPAVRDMASNIERKWRTLVSSVEGPPKPSDNNAIEVDSRSKKRKLPDVSAPNKIGPPAKKPAVSSVSSKPVVVKKDLMKPTLPTVKDAKSDSSFFSAPKAKPRLPSFKKALPTLAAPVPKQPTGNIAQPSSIDPFQEALKSMAKGRKDSPAILTPPATTPPNQQPEPPKHGKKKKFVSWADADKLESIRLIEKAVYDDDPVDGVHVLHNLRDLDRGEGAALHAHVFEETVDWSEPLLIQFSDDLEQRLRGEQSEEKVRQEEREQTALGALYVLPAHIPESPSEATHVITEEETDQRLQTMTCGTEADEVFWNTDMAIPPQTVAELVGQLAVGNIQMDAPLRGTSSAGGFNLATVGFDSSSALSAIQSLPQEHIQQLLQQLANPALFSQTGVERQSSSYGPGDQSGWAGYSSDYSQQMSGSSQYPEETDRGWRGKGRGRGRGRGGEFRHNKSSRETRPCSFFLAGRCKYGDQCDFLHVSNPNEYS